MFVWNIHYYSLFKKIYYLYFLNQFFFFASSYKFTWAFFLLIFSHSLIFSIYSLNITSYFFCLTFTSCLTPTIFWSLSRPIKLGWSHHSMLLILLLSSISSLNFISNHYNHILVYMFNFLYFSESIMPVGQNINSA